MIGPMKFKGHGMDREIGITEGIMDEPCARIEVIAYSGYRANERPLRIIVDDRTLEVKKVIDRWYGPEHDYFKLLAEDAKTYLVKWDRRLDEWYLEKVM